MIKYKNLLNNISDRLHIEQGNNEDKDFWKFRIIYSAIGAMARYSLFDETEDDDEGVSIVHFKRRIQKLFSAYQKMYPDLLQKEEIHIFKLKPEIFADEVYKIFLESGCLYHSDKKVYPTIFQKSVCRDILLMRGSPLPADAFCSGLGTYLLIEESADASLFQSVAKMFALQRTTLESFWQHIVAQYNDFRELPDNKWEFLRMNAPFRKGYFQDIPFKEGISLLRSNDAYNKDYYLYKYEGGKILGCQLHDWQVCDYNYRRIANACLCHYKFLPRSVYYRRGAVVTLKIKYLYPPAELNMIRLYGWPVYVNNDNSEFNIFSYFLENKVFDVIKSEFNRIGYEFEEKKA